MWKVVILNDVVEAEIADLPADMKARLGQVIDLIEIKGFEDLPRGLTRHLGDKLWELRVRGRDGISRAIYVTSTGKRVVILRVFVKKDPTDAAEGTKAGAAPRQGDRMKPFKQLHDKWMATDPEYRREYEALDEEFAMIRALIDARVQAGLTQEQLAEKMETSQSTIARLESGRTMPSGRTLSRYAKATGTKLRISFEAPKKTARR